MTGRISRRELLFQKLPGAVATAAGSCAFFKAAMVLAEPAHVVRLDGFASGLLASHGKRFFRAMEKEYAGLCLEHGLDANNPETERGFTATRLFHELVKVGGILNNRYILIGQRADRIAKAVEGEEFLLSGDELKLRGPQTMLRDMFSGRARYRMNNRSIHCFGDCDEYEMAYARLLNSVGLDARIIMVGPAHVKTVTSVGRSQILVDNTRREYGEAADCQAREYRTGRHGFSKARKARIYVERINMMATTAANIRIWPKGRRRVENRIEKALARWERTIGISAYQEETGQSPSSPVAHKAEEGKAGSR